MNIDVTVRDRRLVSESEFIIPSGSQNDTYIKFDFEPGYGWASLSVTAVFTRKEMKRYRVGVRDGVYVAVPAEVLVNPGVVYVSLLGVKGGDTVATTTPVPMVVGHSSLDILRPTEILEYDRDADSTDPYAEYVRIVTDAVTEVEALAQELEELEQGSYTKAESDARYMKKSTVTRTALGAADTTYLTPGEVPVITIKGVMPDDLTGTLEGPSIFNGVTAVRVVQTGESYEASASYSGFTLRKLHQDACDTLEVGPSGAVWKQYVDVLKLSESPGEWIDATHYRVSAVTCGTINTGLYDYILCNAADVDYTYADGCFTLTLPEDTDKETLGGIYFWIPLAIPNTWTVSSASLFEIAEQADSITIYITVNETEVPADSFEIEAEFNLTAYLPHVEESIAGFEQELEDLKNRVTGLADLIMSVRKRLQAIDMPVAESDWTEYAFTDDDGEELFMYRADIANPGNDFAPDALYEVGDSLGMEDVHTLCNGMSFKYNEDAGFYSVYYYLPVTGYIRFIPRA